MLEMDLKEEEDPAMQRTMEKINNATRGNMLTVLKALIKMYQA